MLILVKGTAWFERFLVAGPELRERFILWNGCSLKAELSTARRDREGLLHLDRL
jgi:hypothetical protein